MKKFQTLYDSQESIPEVNVGPSMTVPDMSMSLSELIRRSTNGLDVPGNKNLRYDDDDDDYELDFVTPQFEKLDLAEREQLANEAAAEVERLRGILNEKAKLKREADKIEADKAALEEYRRIQALDTEPQNKFFVRKEKEDNTNNP